jgi:hypothetical protein
VALHKGVIAELFAGGCAGTLTWFSIMPFDVIKSRYQADMKKEFSGMLDCAFKSYKERKSLFVVILDKIFLYFCY